ncbi:ribonuclease domain-containing protein [Bergeyella sp. RCAD1439]|uniref:ribonuclease domain-containing protein n=1 Tax=Bergeyella anatis TaxID=3113737 RepID=UPI002E16E4E9|nr:ribonuclease domain-containing protein [Bergeyella sp. RCAD1439]
MNGTKRNYVIFFLVGALSMFLGMHVFNNYTIAKKQEGSSLESVQVRGEQQDAVLTSRERIDELTAESRVVSYVKSNGHLPDYYLTKAQARKRGWVASEGNLCEVLPGRAIGGDRFSNRERKFPEGVTYYEADVNYRCGRRGSDRIVFTESGEVWLTHDHYKTFTKQ